MWYKRAFQGFPSRDEPKTNTKTNRKGRRIVYVYPRTSRPQIGIMRSPYRCSFDWPSSICAQGRNWVFSKEQRPGAATRLCVELSQTVIAKPPMYTPKTVSRSRMQKSPSRGTELPFPTALRPPPGAPPPQSPVDRLLWLSWYQNAMIRL